VAQQLADLGWVADLVICSDSTRTRQTLEAMQEARIGLEVNPLPTSKPVASYTMDGCD
jgi:phosphohistidine phosphatase SixA